MTDVRCPQCGHSAEITERFTLGSTDGPLEHVKVVCSDGHWFTCLDEHLVSQAVPAGAMSAQLPAAAAA